MKGKDCCSGMPFFLTSLRLTFGIWLGYVGGLKWIYGSTNFIENLTDSFSKTWAPPEFIVPLGWVILVAEPLIAALLILGIHQRCTWRLTALLMFGLMFGQTILQSPSLAGNWLYLLIALFGASFAEDSCASSTACDSEEKSKGCCG